MTSIWNFIPYGSVQSVLLKTNGENVSTRIHFLKNKENTDLNGTQTRRLRKRFLKLDVYGNVFWNWTVQKTASRATKIIIVGADFVSNRFHNNPNIGHSNLGDSTYQMASKYSKKNNFLIFKIVLFW